MIERVARAIFEIDKNYGLIDGPINWEDVTVERNMFYRNRAQAAIAAMWVPFDPDDESTWPEGLVLCEIHDERDGNCYWPGEISKIGGPGWWFHDRETTASIGVVSRYTDLPATTEP